MSQNLCPYVLASSAQIWLPIFFNAILVFIVGWQAWIYHRQWKIMREQLEHSKEIHQLSERAWIVLKSAALKHPIKVGEAPEISIIFTNTGRTPASNANFKTWVHIADSHTPADKLHRPDLPGRPSQGVIPPGMLFSQNIAPRITLTDQTMQRLTREEQQFYLYGLVEYHDIFDHSWMTAFCLTLNIGTGTLFDICPDGNYLR
jgi:hypothetical protein